MIEIPSEMLRYSFRLGITYTREKENQHRRTPNRMALEMKAISTKQIYKTNTLYFPEESTNFSKKVMQILSELLVIWPIKCGREIVRVCE